MPTTSKLEIARGLFDQRCEGRGHYGFEHSNRTMNCPVHWLESQREHWPVIRVFQSVPFLSKVQKVRPAFETVVQGLSVPGKRSNDAAGRDRDLALVGRITLRHAETAGLFGRGRRVRRRLSLPFVRDHAECESNAEQEKKIQTNQPRHREQAPVDGGIVPQPRHLQRTLC